MKKGKLFETLSLLTKSECERFLDFTRSPYFNKNTKSPVLLKLILEYHPGFDESKLSLEKIYGKIYGNGEPNMQVMKNQLSALMKLLGEFMRIEAGRVKPAFVTAAELMTLESRRIDRIFEEELERFGKDIEALSDNPQLQSYMKFVREELIAVFGVNRGRQSKIIDNIIRSGEYLTIMFVIQLTGTMLNIHMNRFSFNIGKYRNIPEEFFKNIDFEKFFKSIEHDKSHNAVLLRLYYFRAKCNLEPEEESHYREFRKLLYENLALFGKNETHNLIKTVETYCAQKINSGNRKYFREMFENYDKAIKEGFYLSSDGTPLSQLKFRNTYLAGLRSGNTKWAENFINDYSDRIPAEGRRSTVNMAFAHLYFEKKEFEKALEHLSKVRTREIYQKIDVRNIQLMSYYELGYFDSAVSLASSYRQFLKNAKNITQEYSDKCLRFAGAVISLIQLQEKKDGHGLGLLLKSVDNARVDRKLDWISEKIKDAAEEVSGSGRKSKGRRN